MTVHVYWRHPDYPTDPFTCLGHCDAVSFHEQDVSLPEMPETFGILFVELRGFRGGLPPRSLKPFVNRTVLPLGAYEWCLKAHGAR